MIVACKLPNGLDIGGFILRGAFVGPDHPVVGRERIAGYEITRDVPDAVWQRWRGENGNGPIVQNALVHGDNDYEALTLWCWQYAKVRGWSQAPQDAGVAPGIR